jgi:hypothetical protein
VSSYTGENARKLRRPASRRSAPRRAPARVSGSVPCDGRYLDLEASRLALTCPRRAVIRRSGAAPSPGPGSFARSRYQRSSVDKASGEPKKRRSSPAGARKRPGGVDRAEAGGRAVKARSRWRPDDREVVRRRAPNGEVATPLLPEDRPAWSTFWVMVRLPAVRRLERRRTVAAGLLAAFEWQSPEVMSISSARDVNVGCRNGVETS